MTDQPSETILIKYIVEAQEALANAKKVQEQVTSGNEQIKSSNASVSKSYQDVANAITNEGKSANWSKQQINDAIQSEVQRLQQLGTTVTGIPPKIAQMGTAAQNAKGGFTALAAGIGAAFGISAINIVRNFFQTFISLSQQAIQYAFDFAKGMFQLNVGVNALRRAGTDITFSEVLAQLQKLKTEFGIFSMKDLVEGAAAFLNLNRDMGFTKEQLFDLQDAIATLAVVNGRSMDEVQRTVALALSSGYTEGLQRLGVSINRVTIAQEAATLGWDRGYTALTEQQRALATYNLILEKTKVYMDDLLEYQKTLPGQIETTTKKIQDQTVALGQNMLAIKLWVEQVKLLFVEEITVLSGVLNDSARLEFINGLLKQREEALGRILTAEEKIQMEIAGQAAWEAGIKRGALSIQQLFEKYQIPSEKYNPNKIGEPAVTPPSGELGEEQVLALEKLSKEIIDLQTQLDIDRRDLAINLQRDLANIEESGQEKIADIMANHAQKMLDIANKASEQIRDAQIRYDLDVKQAWDEYYSNMASAAEKHANKLLKVEEDYQEKLKRLKEGFLLDLEDALRERDARQVLQLIRRYNLDRTQATRERDQNLKDEERSYREQLNELDRQRNERLKKLKEELDLRLEAIARQRDRELALEIEAYNHKIAQQIVQNEKDKTDRETKYAEDLMDLNTHLQDKLKAIAKSLVDEGTLTGQGMDAIYNIMKQYIGPGGMMERLYNYYIQMSQAAMAAAVGAVIPKTIIPISPIKSYAQGGLEIATKPTAAVFGEKEPELALFLPLSKIAGLSTSTKSPLPEMQMGAGRGKGKLQLEVLLGAGLEGRIINEALNQVADITIRSVRK